jgi:hypothetical protein
VNIKAFFVDALASALDLGVARPDDVLRHVTPDVLAQHLPRPLWARVISACLNAPRVDAKLLVDTIGIANLAEHIPSTIIWACIAEVGARSLGKQPAVAVAKQPDVPVAAAPQPANRPAPQPLRVAPQPLGRSTPQPLTPPPPEVLTAVPRATPVPIPAGAPAIPAPLAAIAGELETAVPAQAPSRSRTPTGQRNASIGGVGRIGATARRPQAAATPAPTRRARSATDTTETETASEIAVDDSQLVDWSAAETISTGDDDFSDLGRKR